MSLAVVTLAAGKGSRMKSARPKVLHTLAGQPMLGHVLDTAMSLSGAEQHVVIGHGADLIREAFGATPVNWAVQSEQKGTGHAVAQALPAISDDSVVLVLYGDVPLIRRDTLLPLVAAARAGNLGLLTVTLPDPGGYGRIVRDASGDVQAIVEHKDATEQQRNITEVNMSTYVFDASHLQWSLAKLQSNNAQAEFYLTDCPSILKQAGYVVEALPVLKSCESLSVNTLEQLQLVEQEMQQLGY